MARQGFPGRFKGGAKGWEQSLERAVQVVQQSMTTLDGPNALSPLQRIRTLSRNHFELGLFSHWRGDEEAAREHFTQAAVLALSYVEGGLPGLTARWAPGYAVPARNGAIAATLTGQEALARTLFMHAERFSSGLVTGEEEKPADPGAVLDPMGIHPLNRAYCLIRLGRLSGFHGLIYPEGEGSEAVWARTDIWGLFRTEERCLVECRSTWPDFHAVHQGLLSVLRALVVALEGGGGEEARQALAAYEKRIRDLADFHDIYPLMVDLRAAFPTILSGEGEA